MMIKRNKGQMTIWIIVALIIVVMIAILFLLRPSITSITQSTVNPELMIDSCVKDAVNSALGAMLPRGGFVEPNNTVMHDNTNVEYLCENIGYFKPCINQHPLLITEMEKEIKKYAEPKIDSCFDSLRDEYESKNYAVTIGLMAVSVKLEPGVVDVITERNITATKNTQTESYSAFKSRINSPAYDMARIAQEIADQEAKYCYFEYVGYSLLYPRFVISVTKYSDMTKVYTISDTQTNKVMNIAIRGCAIPAGL